MLQFRWNLDKTKKERRKTSVSAYDPTTGVGAKKSRVYTYDSIASGCVDWSDGVMATAAVGTRAGVVALWDVVKGSKKGTLRGHEARVESCRPFPVNTCTHAAPLKPPPPSPPSPPPPSPPPPFH